MANRRCAYCGEVVVLDTQARAWVSTRGESQCGSRENGHNVNRILNREEWNK